MAAMVATSLAQSLLPLHSILQNPVKTSVLAVLPPVAALSYSYLFNKRGGWNKREGGAKVAKSPNLEAGINVEGGIFWK